MRFVAAIGVVFHHVGMKLEADVPLVIVQMLDSVRERGGLGVQFFFTLSGFILAYVYSTKTLLDWKSFIRARMARIYPVYLFALVVGIPMLIDGVSEHVGNHGILSGSAISLVKAVMVLLLVQAWLPNFALFWNGVSWSLSAEAFFYACFPRIMGIVRNIPSRRLVVALVCLLAFEISRSLADELYPSLLWGFMPLLRIHEFVSGMIVCVLFLRGWRPGLWMGGLSFLGLLFFILLPQGGVLVELLRTMGMHIGFCVLIASLAISRPANEHAPNWMVPLVFLGQVSYAMYLLHFPLLRIWESLFGAAYLSFGWFLGSLILMSSATYLLIEEPARRWIRKA